MARSRSRSRERRRRSRSAERKPRDRSRERDKERDDRVGKRRHSKERRSRSRSPHERRRSRSRDRKSRDDRRRRDDKERQHAQEPISLDQLVNCEQDISTLMGFTGFNTTKNKKVVDCGEFGYYQGRLISLDADSKDIVLGSAFKEGIPLGKNVTLNGAQIVSLKVLKAAQQVMEANLASTSNNHAEKKDTLQKPNGAKQNGPIVHRSKSTIEFNSTEASQNRNQGGGLHTRSVVWDGSSYVTSLSYTKVTLFSATTAVQNKSSRTAPQRKPSSVSSTSEEGQCVPPDVRSKPRTRSRRVRRSESEHIHSHPVGVSETPHFRSFEPQVPLPRELLVAKVKNRGKTKGPSGNPLLDSKKLHGRIANGNDELVKPIDFELLNTDFDFDANLEQFKRENLEDEYYESVEKQKMSQNFAHYENIIADPARVTSWTNVVGGGNHIENSDKANATARSPMESFKHGSLISLRRSPPIRFISFCPSGYETTYDGFPLPVLDVALKKKYLSECCSTLGSDVYYYLVADRLIMWLIDVVGRNNTEKFCKAMIRGYFHSVMIYRLGISLDRTVVLASSTTPLRLVDRVLSHLDNRGVTTTLYGKFPSFDLGLVSVVDRVSMLPSALRVIIVLSDELTSETQSWLGKQTSSHVISLECAPSVLDYHRLHVLMLGVLTSGVYTVTSNAQPQVGKTSFAQLCATMKANTFIDSAVCDVGAPFSWIAEDGKANLQQAFSTTLLRRLC
ncbi:hypothetical protein OSTOST_08334 [Ostertagia ostertagi]